jgi:hypothetical protein
MKQTPNDQDDFQFRPLTHGLGFHKSKEPQARPTGTPANDYGNTERVEEIFRTLNDRKKYDFLNDSQIQKQSLREPIPETYKPATWDASASLLDAMLITAASLLCVIVLLMVTKVDLFANFYKPDADGMIYLSLVAMVAAIAWIYMVANRVFMGLIPGEWVFDQRLGAPQVLGTPSYALKAVARATVIVGTGGILFPLLSLIFGRDILGRILGIELVKKS